MTDSNLTSRRVIYHGQVQGVGFRAMTFHLARKFPVTGFVRNLPDGTVELLAQGPAEGVHDFLAKVATQFQAHITRIDDLPVTQEISSKGFTVL